MDIVIGGGLPMRIAAFVLALIAAAGAVAEPIAPGAVRVMDGDTIEAHGRVVRLVGFDTPETGSRAKCESERRLGARAAMRLHQLVAAGGLDLSLVPCACRPGTEGTRACNHGRACGVLRAAGRDVGPLLISEGLAQAYA
jgi:endonuclease YncB( thermonuclease family)